MFTVELLFHDNPRASKITDVIAVVHGLAAVTVDREHDTLTYPWVNVHRVKEYE